MRNRTNTTIFASLAALTIGVGLASSSGAALAYYNQSTTQSVAGVHNPPNPLLPASNESGSIGFRVPVMPVGQGRVNCHLTNNHASWDCN
jgi:hypothetical protein